MDPVTLGMAKAYSKKQAEPLARQRQFAAKPFQAPICAGRPFRPYQFSAYTDVTFQRSYKLLTDAPVIQLVFWNVVMQGGSSENSAGPYTIGGAEVVPVGGANIAVTFAGSASVTVPQFGIVISDPIHLPYGVGKGKELAVRTYVTQPASATNLPQGPGVGGRKIPYGSTLNEGWTATNRIGSGFDWSGSGGGQVFGPSAIIGWPANERDRTTILFGDSIMSGTGYSSSYSSFGQRALELAGIPGIALSRGGETLANFMTWSAAQRRVQLSTVGVNGICNYGTNDLDVSTVAVIKANMLAHWADCARRGLKMFHCTIIPKTTSTDLWQTVANQTVLGSGVETARQQVNQWLRAPASAGAGNSAMFDAAGTLAGVFDVAAPMEVNANGSLITINPATGAISNGAGGFTYCDTTVVGTLTATATGAGTVTDSSKAWAANQWLDFALVVTADATTPASVGQFAMVTANTATQLTLDRTLATLPSVGATFKLIRVYQTDGTHPTTFGHDRMTTAIDTTKL